MARIEGEIVIRRPVEEVFDFVADERNEPLYNPRMAAADLITDGPVGRGSRFSARLKTGGRVMPMLIEFADYERPRRLVSSTHSSMVDIVGALTFEPVPRGTRMGWSWDVQPRGALQLVPAVVGLVGRRQEQAIWRNLKRLLETAPSRENSHAIGEPRVARIESVPVTPTSALGRRPASADVTDGGIASKILVAYATQHGSTKGVAKRIADRLRERGANVNVRAVDEVTDLEPYGPVVLGSAVYGQRWVASATDFVRQNAEALAGRRVWLFSVGSFGDTDRLVGRVMRREPRDIGELEGTIHPCDYRVFAGAIERHQWPLASRVFFHAFGGRFGDNRDWPQIDAWAVSIANSLRGSDGDGLHFDAPRGADRDVLAGEQTPSRGSEPQESAAGSRRFDPVRDALRLAGVMLAAPFVRRAVRPVAAERGRSLPGDELVADAKLGWTHAVTIDARPADIWPWLIQMGCRRAGWYSYDGLDNSRSWRWCSAMMRGRCRGRSSWNPSMRRALG